MRKTLYSRLERAQSLRISLSKGIQESVAATGVRVLSSPLKEDPRILQQARAGAAPIGAVIALLADPNLSEIKNKLQLNKSSKILCFFN